MITIYYAEVDEVLRLMRNDELRFADGSGKHSDSLEP